MASTVIQSPGPARALGLATAATFCALAASVLTITVIGRPHRTAVIIDLALPQSAPKRVAAAPPASAPPVAAIDKPAYAGHALVADPALIENSPIGPLPRIAD